MSKPGNPRRPLVEGLDIPPSVLSNGSGSSAMACPICGGNTAVTDAARGGTQ